MKKTMTILVVAALILILAAGGLIWYLISTISGAGGPVQTVSVEDYLAGQWPAYGLEDWNPETGSLRLSRGLRLSYEQLERYGDQPEMNDLVHGHLDTMNQIAVGMVKQCGVEPKQITIVGLSSDGKEAYAVSSDGTITTCWSARE